MIRLIAAIDQQRGLAKGGVQPWFIPEDERYFIDQTKSQGGTVLVGHTTFENSFHGRPLAGRQTYVLTSRQLEIEGVTVIHDLAVFLQDFTERNVWVAGGAQVYQQVMEAGKADELYLTTIAADFGCQQFFPDYGAEFTLVSEDGLRTENGFIFSYQIWRRIA
jgi:dihydrofolate reductase